MFYIVLQHNFSGILTDVSVAWPYEVRTSPTQVLLKVRNTLFAGINSFGRTYRLHLHGKNISIDSNVITRPDLTLQVCHE
jgi:hypothetical protein